MVVGLRYAGFCSKILVYSACFLDLVTKMEPVFLVVDTFLDATTGTSTLRAEIDFSLTSFN